MKVAHLVAGDLDGGAARGAYWMHLALLQEGINSTVLTNSFKKNLGQNVTSVSSGKVSKLKSILREEIDSGLSIFYKNREKKIFSTGVVGYNFTKTIQYKEANIVHLHWVNNGFVNMKHLAKVKKPIVWTLRDMWPMTGGCHYSYECENYNSGCGCCKQLNSHKKNDLSRMVLRRKQKLIPKNTTLVGISNWISEVARKSYLFNGFDIRTIFNGINTDEFIPIEKNIAKQSLGILSDKTLILCGACSLKERYKGFSKYIEAMNYLDRSKYLLCFFGNLDESEVSKLGFEFINFGYLHDILLMRLVYSAADIFVAPSIMEAFGKTLVESLACGTPVVCFDATGPQDIIDHKVNGYKAEPFNCEDLAEGINWISKNKDSSQLILSSREKAVNAFDTKIVAKKYLDIYCELLNK